jgi:hypothetical protein
VQRLAPQKGKTAMPDSTVDLTCLDEPRREGDSPCKGAVEYRFALSASGRNYPRCDGHWSARLDAQDRHNRRYGHPDSVSAPSWFDPTYAGESWNDEG